MGTEMRHIKIYEEYSDDELRDLIGDLEKVGHKHKLVQGEDFGFGPDLKGQNDGKTILFLTPWALKQIEESNLTYSADNRELMWPTWPEFKDAYNQKIPIPKILKSEDLKSIEYPPTMAAIVYHDRPIKGLYFISLSDNRTGRNFPLNYFDAKSSFISAKKVASAYDIIVNKLKSLNI
jgi:hypothetical protein